MFHTLHHDIESVFTRAFHFKMRVMIKRMRMKLLSSFIFILVFITVICEDSIQNDASHRQILTVEEIESVHCMDTPSPYSGLKQVKRIRKRTSFIGTCFFRNVYKGKQGLHILYLSNRKDYSS